MNEGAKAPRDEPTDHQRESHTLWFNPPTPDGDRRAPLTRERVVAEALTVIAQEGVGTLTMRILTARLRVVPGALYRHVRNKERLQDLVLDGVLAEVDPTSDPSQSWTQQLTVLAHRLRGVLEAHPGVAGLLRLRDPLGPNSLAVAEAFLTPLQAAGFPNHQAGLAYFLIVDYTTGFAAGSPPISTNEQRVRNQATRSQLHEFFRSLPTDRFPALAALGEHVWVDNRDERFTGPGARPTGGRSTGNRPQPPRRQPDDHRCTRWVARPGAAAGAAGPAQPRLPLPSCGFAFALAYASLVSALTELQSMTGDRLRLDRATVIGPVAGGGEVVAPPARPAHPRRTNSYDWLVAGGVSCCVRGGAGRCRRGVARRHGVAAGPTATPARLPGRR